MKFCFDWDGTLAENGNDETGAVGPWKDGAVELIESLLRARHEITIFSARNNPRWGPGQGPDSVWFKNMVDAIRSKFGLRVLIDDGRRGKPIADYYFDDKALGVGTGLHQVSLHWIEMTFGVARPEAATAKS